MVKFSKDGQIDLDDVILEGFDFLEEGIERHQNQSNEIRCRITPYMQQQLLKPKFDWFLFGFKLFEGILLLTCGLLATNFTRNKFDFDSTLEYLIVISFSFFVLNAIIILMITMDLSVKKSVLAIMNSLGAILVSTCGGVTMHVWLFSTTGTDDILVHSMLDFVVALAYLAEVAANARSMASLDELIMRRIPHHKTLESR